VRRHKNLIAFALPNVRLEIVILAVNNFCDRCFQAPVIIRFSKGIMAGIPRCCQQRPVPRTRRWQGVPFCVRAPQMVITSLASVGRSVEVPSGP
jgi:hypothetical protein